MVETILQTKQLTKRFGGVNAVDHVDFSIAAGELAAIIGPNGAGKTTFINLLSGALRPDLGSIVMFDEDVTHLPVFARSSRGLARSFQITSIFPEMSVAENVALAAQGHAGHSFRFWKPVAGDRPLQRAALEMLDELGLRHLHERPASMLSHGEQRLLEIAMALVTRPRLLLLDEPTAGLGIEESREMVKFISTLKRNLAILLVEHDMEAVFTLADKILVLASGAVVASGTVEQIKTDAKVRIAYLGDDEDA